jgi:hypothetical protein
MSDKTSDQPLVDPGTGAEAQTGEALDPDSSHDSAPSLPSVDDDLVCGHISGSRPTSMLMCALGRRRFSSGRFEYRVSLPAKVIQVQAEDLFTEVLQPPWGQAFTIT